MKKFFSQFPVENICSYIHVHLLASSSAYRFLQQVCNLSAASGRGERSRWKVYGLERDDLRELLHWFHAISRQYIFCRKCCCAFFIIAIQFPISLITIYSDLDIYYMMWGLYDSRIIRIMVRKNLNWHVYCSDFVNKTTINFVNLNLIKVQWSITFIKLVAAFLLPTCLQYLRDNPIIFFQCRVPRSNLTFRNK